MRVGLGVVALAAPPAGGRLAVKDLILEILMGKEACDSDCEV